MTEDDENIIRLKCAIAHLDLTNVVYGLSDDNIIVYSFAPHTISDDDKTVFDKDMATYSADTLNVLTVFNRFTGVQNEEFINQPVESTKSTTTQITYYKTLERTYYQELETYNTTGKANGWFSDGRLEHEGFIDCGLRTGKWIFYFSSGIQRMVGSYVNDEAHGEWIFKNEEGKIIEQGSYNQGKKDGQWIEYLDDVIITNTYENDRLCDSTMFKAGKKTKTQIFNDDETTIIYDADERIVKKTLINKKQRTIIEFEWYPSGRMKSEISFKDRQRSNIWTYFKDNDTNDIEKQFDYSVKDDA